MALAFQDFQRDFGRAHGAGRAPEGRRAQRGRADGGNSGLRVMPKACFSHEAKGRRPAGV